MQNRKKQVMRTFALMSDLRQEALAVILWLLGLREKRTCYVRKMPRIAPRHSIRKDERNYLTLKLV